MRFCAGRHPVSEALHLAPGGPRSPLLGSAPETQGFWMWHRTSQSVPEVNDNHAKTYFLP